VDPDCDVAGRHGVADARGQFAVSAQQIAASIGKAGMQIAPDQLTLLTDVVATTATPVLAVRSVQRSGASSLLVRLECQNLGECLPFFVNVRVRPGNAVQLLEASSNAAQAAPPRSTSALVRTGMPATLELDGGRVHIHIPVVCLENGRKGQIVRARDKESRQVYAAEVVESGLLRGRL